MTGPVPRYTDPFLNALMDSHQATLKAQLWYRSNDPGYPWILVDAPLNIVAGSVTGDRGASVRLTATLTVDPGALADATLGPRLNPYGTRIKIWRGIRYPSGLVDEEQVFYGRIESVDKSLNGVELRCSDLAADVVDARFFVPWAPDKLTPPQTTVLGCIKGLIDEVHPGITFDTDRIVTPALTAPVQSGTTWLQERGDALDGLATQLQGGSEWYLDALGVAHVHPLPAVITASTKPVWIIDSGDDGVLVERTVTQDRSGVCNGVNVTGEAVGGVQPAVGTWINDGLHGADPNDPMLWGGPFGKVVNYYTGQQLDPNRSAAADELAKTLGLNSLALSKSVSVTCIPNPKLKLGDVVRVTSGSIDLDGMYFVNSFTLPLDPETPMTLSLLGSIQVNFTARSVEQGWRWADLRIPEGATWQPTR